MERLSITNEGSTHLAVRGEEGAVSFYYFQYPQRPDRSDLMAGDVVIHDRAEKHQPPLTYPCDYFGDQPCVTHYWSGTHVLDMLVDEGVDAVYAKLEDVYARHFKKEAQPA